MQHHKLLLNRNSDNEVLFFNFSKIFSINDELVLFYFITEKHKIRDGKHYTPQYIVAHRFSRDFKTHKNQFVYYECEATQRPDDAFLYQENGRYFLKTNYYYHFGQLIGKIFEITDDKLIEISDSPPSQQKLLYSEQKSYEFGNLIIKMKSAFVMQCKDKRKILWTLKIRAYLYSEVIENQGVIYFSTDGNGKAGRVFGVSLADGQIIWEYDNAGSEILLWTEQGLLTTDLQRKPVIICPKTGTEIKKIDFGEFHFNFYGTKVYLEDNRLYGIALDSQNIQYLVMAEI